MKNSFYVGWMCLCFGTLGGYFAGRFRASEDFYKRCQGGEVHLLSGVPIQVQDAGTNMITVTGCAEIARRIR